MCLHTHKAIQKALINHQGTTWAVLWLTGPADPQTGQPEVFGIDCVDFTSPRDISSTIRNLRAWHPTSEGWQIHLEDVNVKRLIKGMPPVTPEGLPEPEGRAPPSSDPEAAAIGS